MNRKEMKQLLEERFERIALLETRIDTMEQLIEGYHAREQSLIDTLHTAQNTSRKLVDDARTEADAIREKARREGETLLDETMRAAQAAMEQAQQQANELRISAKNESDRMLRDAEIIKSEYEELVDSFNAMLEQNANELRETADRFAEFVRGRKIEAPEVKLDGEAFYKSVGALNDARLPDPDGDPSTLMKNIYLLQKRPLPTAENLGAEESTERGASADPAAEEEHPLEQPYSEQAWASEYQQSKSEPQAEFAQAFEPVFTPSNFEVQTGDCAVEAGEAEHAFDEYFSTQEPQGTQQATGAASLPYSSAVREDARNVSGQEPQAEAERAFDEFFSGSFEPAGKAAQDAVSPDLAQGPQGATPEPYSEMAWAQGAFTSSHEPQAEGALAFDTVFGEPETAANEPISYEGVSIEEPSGASFAASEAGGVAAERGVEPEPYSELAWAQSAITSNHEPQAEGALAFDAMFGESAGSGSYEPAYDGENAGTGAFEQSYSAEQEPREWEPEHEPEADEIPTVSRFIPRSDEGEVSLDALLEEIIKAGE